MFIIVPYLLYPPFPSNFQFPTAIINFFENENIKIIIKNNKRFDLLSLFRNNILSMFLHSFQRAMFKVSFLFIYLFIFIFQNF